MYVVNDAVCQYWRVLVKFVFGAGRYLAVVISSATLLVGALLPELAGSPGRLALAWPFVLMLGGPLVTTVVHEGGHVLACLGVRAKIRAVYLGTDAPGRPRLTVGKVVISWTVPSGGRVVHDNTWSAGRNALIQVAGALATLIAAGALAAAQPGNAFALGLALVMAGSSAVNLLPYRARSGRFTDGARLLAAAAGGQFAEAVRQPATTVARGRFTEAVRRPRDANGWTVDAPPELRADLRELERGKDGPPDPERTTRCLAAYYRKEALAWVAVGTIGRSLRREGRIAELLKLHADLLMPAGRLAQALTMATHQLAWEVLLVPGLPPDAAACAADRVNWVLDTAEFTSGNPARWYREAVLHTLALAKLRLGQFTEVEELCQSVLGLPGLPPENRATVLATIALARKALGQPCRQLLAEAASLAPTADLVSEATAAAQLQTQLTPERPRASRQARALGRSL